MYKSTFSVRIVYAVEFEYTNYGFSSRSSEAAFGLHGCFSGSLVLYYVGARATAKEIRKDQPESLPWDTPEEPLPRELE